MKAFHTLSTFLLSVLIASIFPGCLSPDPHVIITVEDPLGLAAEASTLSYGKNLDLQNSLEMDGKSFPFTFVLNGPEEASAVLWIDARNQAGETLGRGRVRVSLNNAGATVELGYYCSTDALDIHQRCALAVDNDGVGYTGVCDLSGECTSARCGDGVVDETQGETCDDGPQDTALCNYANGSDPTSCRLSLCGDSYANLAANEECDEGENDTSLCNYDDGQSAFSCTNTSCGDSYINSTDAEACDDGNQADNDYCSADCSVKSGECGDGLLHPIESCDDANSDDEDGCSNICELSANFYCPESGSPCLYRLFVNDDASGANDGTTWADAYLSLQDALADVKLWRAAIGMSGISAEIWVAEGTYYPDDLAGTRSADRSESFELQNHLSILGGFVDGENDLQARDPTTYEVILSGNIGSTATETDNTYHVVTGQDVDQTALLDGVTVTAGYANGGGDAAHGGGLWLQNTTARILSCKVDANYAIENGGGAYVSGLSDSSGPLFENLVIWTHNSASQGGAIFAETSQLSIHGNIFANNLSRQGGAIFADHSNLTITDSGLNANKASLDSANGNGGALYQNAGTVFVHDCLFLENEAGTGANASADQAGEDGGHGGAIYAVSATLDIVESNIHYNAAGSGGNAWLPESETTCEKVSPAGAGGKGGAIFATTTAIRIWNSMLRSNTGGHGGSDAENTSYTGGDCIEDSGSGGHGGAIFQSGGSLEMLNSFVYQNSAGDKPATNANAGSSSAAGYGGAIYLSAATSHIINTTMSLNTTGHNDTGKPENSGHGGGVAMNGSNQLSIQNSILWDNKRWGPSIIEDNLWLPQDEVATVSYSVLDSGAAVHMSAGSLGNIFNDPGFLNPDEAANYTLIPSSPCIDAGNNDFLPEDIFDLDGDGNITELAPLDYEGLPRRVDDVAEDDTGEGIAPIVDMGAFEAQ